MRPPRNSLLVPVLCLAFLAATGPDPSSFMLIVRHPVAWAAGSPVDVAVTEVAALGAWLCLTWLVGAAALVVAARTPGATGRIAGAIARRVLPSVLRRVLEAALGLSLAAGGVAGTALPALAQQVPGNTSTADSGPFDRPASPPIIVNRPVDPIPAPVAKSAVANTSLATAHVVVVPGDSLWRIAAAGLGAGASDADIDRTWRRWYAANTRVIGADPHLIHPGQRLIPPA